MLLAQLDPTSPHTSLPLLVSAKAVKAMAALTHPLNSSCSRKLAVADMASTFLFYTTCGHIPGTEASYPGVHRFSVQEVGSRAFEKPSTGTRSFTTSFKRPPPEACEFCTPQPHTTIQLCRSFRRHPCVHQRKNRHRRVSFYV